MRNATLHGDTMRDVLRSRGCCGGCRLDGRGERGRQAEVNLAPVQAMRVFKEMAFSPSKSATSVHAKLR